MPFLRYAIVENLRYFLSTYNTSEPLYFGNRFKLNVNQSYMVGGAGYVLSREAVRRFVEEALPDKQKCRQDPGAPEDVEMGEFHLYDVLAVPGHALLWLSPIPSRI
jgi:glycoprotein-N-acetylgalactosamine 3-beta-galactosyltransferase